MIKEELGLIKGGKNPMYSYVSTFIGFNLVELISFMIFMMKGIDLNREAFVYSIVGVYTAFFLVEMIKGKIVKKSMIRSRINTLIIDGITIVVAYLVGYKLNFLVS